MSEAGRRERALHQLREAFGPDLEFLALYEAGASFWYRVRSRAPVVVRTVAAAVLAGEQIGEFSIRDADVDMLGSVATFSAVPVECELAPQSGAVRVSTVATNG